jgi:hypothetical protein
VKRILRHIAGPGQQAWVQVTDDHERKSNQSHHGDQANTQTSSADADHAGADDRRSVSGWCVMLNGEMIS